jgi:hypothetical protein
MTPELCGSYAKSMGHKRFGVQSGISCFTGRPLEENYRVYGVPTDCVPRDGYDLGTGNTLINNVYTWN